MKFIKYLFEAFFVYLIFIVIRIVGLNLGRKISAFIFSNVGTLFRSKKIIKENISNAFDGINNNDSDKIMKLMWNYWYIK